MKQLGVCAFFFAAVAMWCSPALAETFDLGSSCQSDADCAVYEGNPWCSPNGLCNSCENVGMSCEDGETCVQSRCVTNCQDTEECDGVESMCDVAAGHCVQCEASSDCLDDEYCASDFCLPDRCTANTDLCQGDNIHTCNADGGSSEQTEACTFGCVDDGSAVACADGPMETTTTGETSTGSGADTSGATPAEESSSTSDSDDGTSAAPEDGPASDGGCGCTSSDSEPGLGALALLVLAGLARRRRC